MTGPFYVVKKECFGFCPRYSFIANSQFSILLGFISVNPVGSRSKLPLFRMLIDLGHVKLVPIILGKHALFEIDSPHLCTRNRRLQRQVRPAIRSNHLILSINRFLPYQAKRQGRVASLPKTTSP